MSAAASANQDGIKVSFSVLVVDELTSKRLNDASIVHLAVSFATMH
jgi:hypothetical protein